MRKLLSVLMSFLMIMACALPAFAEDGDDDSPTVLRIPDGTKVVTSSTLDDGVIERLRVKTIYVPSSVTTIKEGALTKYANVTNVYVENSKDNITIESGALPAGTNIVYTEKTTTTTTTATTTTSTTKKADESTTTTTKKDDEDKSSTTKTTKKTTTTTKKNGKTVSSSATTSDPKNRTTVKRATLTIKSTKKTTVKGGGAIVPDVEVDPDTIVEEPDPGVEEETTVVTFAGEAITDKDGTIIGFEDPQENKTGNETTNARTRGLVFGAVGLVGLSAVVFLFFKFRKRP